MMLQGSRWAGTARRQDDKPEDVVRERDRERKIRTVTIGGRRLVPATEIQRLLGNGEVANEAQ